MVRFLRIKLSQPQIVLGVSLLLLLAYLIVVPVITLIGSSSSFSMIDAFQLPGVKEGQLTLYYWKKVLTNHAIFIQPFLNTLLIGIASTGVIAVIGTMLAWLVSKTDMPMKGLFYTAETEDHRAEYIQ